MRIISVAARHIHPWWRFTLIPILYVGWDASDRSFTVGLELWGAYAELCFVPEEE